MRGNKNIKDYSPMVDNGNIDIAENNILIQQCIDVFESKTPCLDNPVEVEQAIKNYFLSCIDKGLRPGNLGLYAVLGLDKNDVRDLLQGRVRTVNGQGVNVETISHIKKACKVISLYRESLGSAGKLNPATLIFWQKNYDGLEDVQRVDVAPVNTLTADRTPEEIAADIPVDDD